ncbi:MAG TPA: glycosyltransferase [Opitutus sp.]|nr:glycosyltransferase [Opitutus sp.]
MNILFVNYGDFTTNSLNHVGAFAGRLTLLGHACVVAVPENPETISAIHEPLFTPVTFARALESEPIFPDRRGADVVHAWTPRENVRDFSLRYLRANPSAALIIHLEDNEAFLIESYAHEPLEKLCGLSDEELAARLSPRLSHPVRFRNFLRLAHGVTCITGRLREFVPTARPVHRLLPGIDAALLAPATPDPALRQKLGASPGEKLLVYTGSTNFATLADLRTLVLAVRLINERGTPCRLVRTGIHPPELQHELTAIGGDRVIDLGFIAKPRLRPLLALADVLVQPGAPDEFNDYRLPSKVPEFLAAGRPVILPRANIAREMEDGRHALLLDGATPEEIADKCLRVFADAALAQRLGAGALEFARAHFDLAVNTAGLLGFYEHIRLTAAPIFPDPSLPASEDVLLAEGEMAGRMRAKEQTIEASRALIARLQGQIEAAALEHKRFLAQSNYHDARHAAQVSYQYAKIQEGRNKVETLRGHLSTVIASLKSLTRDLAAANARAASATTRAEILEARATALTAAATEAAARAAAEIALREDRIARMTDSFSWRITSPLRALRRQVVDPLQQKSAPPAAAPASPPAAAESSSTDTPAPPAAVDGNFLYSIDEPTDWDNIPPSGALRGWVLSNNGGTVGAVRVLAEGKILEAATGLARPDVAIAHPTVPHALESGFAVEYVLTPGSRQTLTFEALTPALGWRCFAQVEAAVSRDDPEQTRRHYPMWVQRFDTLTPERTVEYRLRIDALPPLQRPCLSIVMPVYNTPAAWLERAIESVRAQIYPHWELCIADDASTALHVRGILEDFARRDDRIKVTFREENGHISAASNSALALATGEFTAFLDHDDELPPHALAEVVLALAARPDLEFIYSDEDKIDELGHRFEPYFKPDWNPDLLLGQNYTCHLSVFRTARLRAIGGFRTGYEGSQDWDLTLRATEGLEPARIFHLPRVLYHWRAIPGSTALVANQKENYPVVAARRALADHLERNHLDAELVSVAGLHWRVKFHVPSPAPKVSIIVLTKNAEGLIRLCLGSVLAKTTYPNLEIIVVNNGSDEPGVLKYFEELRALQVRVIDCDRPFNFSALNNLAVREATGSVLAFLNNDIEVITPGWLDEMAAQALRPEIGCVGAMLYFPDDTVQHAGVVLGLTGRPDGKDGVGGHAFKRFKRGTEGQRNRLRLVQNYSAVTAACLVVRRDLFDRAGGFNERELAVAFNDIDFCLRVRALGCRNLWTPFAEFYHRESASRGAEDTAEKQQRFKSEISYMRAQWGPLLDRDPAYNPNLSLHHEDFTLAFPPR